MIGTHMYVVDENNDLLNVLAIHCLEFLGIENPTEIQIKAMENALEQEQILLNK